MREKFDSNLNEWLNKRGKLEKYLILICFVTSTCINQCIYVNRVFFVYKSGGQHWVGRFSSAQGLATGTIVN